MPVKKKRTRRPSAKQIDSYYIDQAMVSTQYFDRHLFAVYTPHGIRMLEGAYCEKMRNMPTKEYADDLRREIKKNPHLHEKIKENLLLNLKNYRKLIGPDSKARWQEIEDKTPYEGRKVRIKCGVNKDMIGVIVWYDPGNLGIGRVAVKSDNPKFWPSLYRSESDPVQYYDRQEVEVIPPKSRKAGSPQPFRRSSE